MAALLLTRDDLDEVKIAKLNFLLVEIFILDHLSEVGQQEGENIETGSFLPSERGTSVSSPAELDAKKAKLGPTSTSKAPSVFVTRPIGLTVDQLNKKLSQLEVQMQGQASTLKPKEVTKLLEKVETLEDKIKTLNSLPSNETIINQAK